MTAIARPAPTAAEIPSSYRTHTCGELRRAQVGARAKLCGALDRRVDERTYDIRDCHGTTRVRLSEAAAATIPEQLLDVPEPTVESFFVMQGEVVARAEPDAANPTGEVELAADDAELLNQAKSPILRDFREEFSIYDRQRFRYMYLRRPEMHRNFAFKTDVLAALRRFCIARGFDELETPILSDRWTPEATESFLAARGPRQVFALPNRRPVFGPLLMAAGYDRTFEVQRRFRRKRGYGPLDQPEFTVLDLMMAYVDEGDLLAMAEELFATVWKDVMGAEARPIRRISLDEAWLKYGTDLPDLRIGLEIQDATRLAANAKDGGLRAALTAGGALRFLRIPDGASRLGPEAIARIVARAEGTKAAVHCLSVDAASGAGPGGSLDPETAAALLSGMSARPRELVLLVASSDRIAAATLAGQIRLEVGRALGVSLQHATALVTRPPYQWHDPATGRWTIQGDPLARPVDGDLGGEPRRMRAQAFRLVLDGVEIGGGAVLNHDLQEQQRVLAALGFSPADVEARWGRLLRALASGTPPHGRITLGIERLAAILKGLPSIEELIALPKTRDGLDPLTRSPWPIDAPVLRTLLGV